SARRHERAHRNCTKVEKLTRATRAGQVGGEKAKGKRQRVKGKSERETKEKLVPILFCLCRSFLPFAFCLLHPPSAYCFLYRPISCPSSRMWPYMALSRSCLVSPLGRLSSVLSA